MYCRNCGKQLNDEAVYCTGCGAAVAQTPMQTDSADRPSFGYALLGFFVPLVGLILFLVNEAKKPKMAKSAAKGALIGFITVVVLLFALIVLGVVFSVNNTENETQIILEKYVDVSFGDVKLSDKTDMPIEAVLEVVVKNKADRKYSYYMTIAATDSEGIRIGDIYYCYADQLLAGQSMRTTVQFYCYSQDDVDRLKNATFEVLEINKFEY